jgi:membrane-associated phospholipid phosphatase
MFQTTLNLWLQARLPDAWTTVMRAVSAAGTEPFFALLLAVLVFGVSFRRGFVLLQAVLWSSVLNSAVKDLLALPRPVHVDARLLDAGGPNLVAACPQAPTPGFWEGLPADVIARVRTTVRPGGDEYGFPSGHVQSHVVLWGTASQLWSAPWIGRLAPWAVALMALSRLHLGRHFLADVVGGAAMGLVVVAAIGAAGRAGWGVRLFPASPAAVRRVADHLATWLVCVAAPLATIPFYPGRGGTMLGVGVGFLLARRDGLPPDTGSAPQRVERVGIALVCYATVSGLLVLGGGMLGPSGAWWSCLSKAVPACAMVWGTVTLSRRRGLYPEP